MRPLVWRAYAHDELQGDERATPPAGAVSTVSPMVAARGSIQDDRMTTPQIRRASASDAARLTEIAHHAKAHWGYDDELLALWDDDLTLTEDFIESHPVFCAVHAEDIVGLYALTREGSTFELEHMWVDPGHIGTGAGRLLFEHAVIEVRARGGAALRIASDPNAEGFYIAMGARRVGDVPSRPAGRTLPLLELDIKEMR